jgi:hypothetical protein
MCLRLPPGGAHGVFCWRFVFNKALALPNAPREPAHVSFLRRLGLQPKFIRLEPLHCKEVRTVGATLELNLFSAATRRFRARSSAARSAFRSAAENHPK